MSNNRYGVNMNIIAQKLLHNSIYTMKSTKVQTLGGDERTCYRRFYVSKVEEDWPTQTSVKGSRRGKHATKRGPFFAVYLLCFSSTIGLVNVLCRIVAYVRTGYVTEIISRLQEQIAKGLGTKPVCRSTRMCCTANWWVAGQFYRLVVSYQVAESRQQASYTCEHRYTPRIAISGASKVYT